MRQAQQAVDAATRSQHVQRQRTLADTANAYWNLWTARALVTIAEGSLNVAQEEQRLVHARVELGEIAPVERSRVDALVVQAETGLLEAQNEQEALQDVLLLLIGQPLDSVLELVTTPDSPRESDYQIEDLIENALANSPEMALAIAEEDNARADVETAEHALLPQLNLAANYALLGYETRQAAALSEMFGADLPEWSVGMNFSMPVGNRSARGNLHSARAVLTQKTISRETTERTIRQQIRAQVRNLSSATSRLGLEEQRLMLAEETLEAERALRDAGRTLEKNVLDAIQATTDAHVAVEQARVNYLLALIELERLQGAL